MTLIKDFSFSTVSAGFVTVLVGFARSAIIVFQAANALGATPGHVAPWMWSPGLGLGKTGIFLSLH